jgi:hypothetical protein
VPAKPAQELLVAVTVGRELPVAEQPSLLVDHGGVMVRPWVSTPPMTTLVRLGMLVSPFRSRHEPGQARTGRAGGHTSDEAWSHKLVSVTSPSGRVHLHTALPHKPTAPGMTPTGQGGSGSDPPGRTSPIIRDHRHLHWRFRSLSALGWWERGGASGDREGLHTRREELGLLSVVTTVRTVLIIPLG